VARPYQRESARPAAKREPILVVPLRHGGTDGGEPITELPLFRRVNVGDLEAADEAKGQIGKIVILASRLSGLTVREVRELDADDRRRGRDLSRLTGSLWRRSSHTICTGSVRRCSSSTRGASADGTQRSGRSMNARRRRRGQRGRSGGLSDQCSDRSNRPDHRSGTADRGRRLYASHWRVCGRGARLERASRRHDDGGRRPGEIRIRGGGRGRRGDFESGGR
jgi:hypothetical protein